MKGHCITLDGQLVCIFPFTDATEFEGLAHNDLPSHALVYDDGKDYEPFSLERANDDMTCNYYGFCFLSCPLHAFTEQDYCIIAKSDRDALATLALENDAWAAEQVKAHSKQVRKLSERDMEIRKDYPRHMDKWTDDDDRIMILCDKFDLTAKLCSMILQRTLGSIESRDHKVLGHNLRRE